MLDRLIRVVAILMFVIYLFIMPVTNILFIIHNHFLNRRFRRLGIIP